MAGVTGEIGQLVHLTVAKVLRPGQEPALTLHRLVVAPIVLERRLKLKVAMQTIVQVRLLSLVLLLDCGHSEDIFLQCDGPGESTYGVNNPQRLD